jgi:hypothetical protein
VQEDLVRFAGALHDLRERRREVVLARLRNGALGSVMSMMSTSTASSLSTIAA